MKIAESVQQTVADAKWWTNDTKIYRISPTVIGPASDRKFVLITMRGVHFDKSKPILEVDGAEMKRISLSQQEAKFKVLSSMLPNLESEIDIIADVVKLESEKCKFFFLCCKKNKIPFKTAFFTLPKRLALINSSYRTRVEQRIYSTKRLLENSVKRQET